MRIATKVNIFFLVVVLVLAAFSMSFFYFVARDDLQNEIYRALELTSVSRARHVETFLQNKKVELQIIGSSRVIRDLLATPKNTGEYFKNFKRVEKRLNSLLAMDHGVVSCSILDPKGRVAVSTDKAIIGSDQSADPVFSRGKKAFYASRVRFSDRADKKLVLDLSMPIVEKGKFLGVIVHELTMSRLWKITADRTGLGETGEIYIVDRDGYMITPSRFVKNAVLRQKVDTFNFRLSVGPHKDLVGHREVSVFRDYRGVRVLGAHEYIPGMEWSLLSEIDANEAFAPLTRLRTAFIFVLLFVPISIWLLLNVLVSRIVTRPIAKLQNGVERVAAGELDFRVGTKERDEIGALSRGFDKMTGSLKESTTSIDNLNKEIVERKRAEGRLRASEVRFRELADSITDVFFAMDKNLRYTYWNKASEILTGIKAEDAIGRSIFDLFPDNENTRRAVDVYQNVLKTKQFQTFAIEYALDGKKYFFEISAYPAREGIAVFTKDITERKRAEEEKTKLAYMLNERMKEFRCLYSVANAIRSERSIEELMVDTTKYIREAWQYPGITRSKIRFDGKEYKGIEFEETKYKQAEDVVVRGKTRGRVEVYYLEEKPTIDEGPFMKEERRLLNEIACYLGIYAETIEMKKERKRAEEHLMKKNKELEELYEIKSQFTSAVSHELRTPLTSIKEGIGIVLDGSAGRINKDQKEFLDLAKRNVDRLHRLINDVLDFSKLESKGVEFNMRPGNIVDAVKETVNSQMPVARKKGLYLKLESPDKIPALSFDTDRIAQVMTNLLNNAVEFTEKGGVTVSVSKDEEKKAAKVCVSDTGRGIKREDIPRLFLKFKQLGSVEERKTGGTGLGLAICKEIITQHKGKIWVESEGQKGSRFYFTLPLGKTGGKENG